MGSDTPVRLARVYAERSDADGHRILVDRLWPRGILKADPRIGEWNREVAPSTELRKWYGHQPERFAEFCLRYEAELADGEPAAALRAIAQRARQEQVTLVTATHDLDQSHLVVLAKLLNS